ncbi:MAG TPA: O-antigen ligase family protein [Solirubrobacteraceae bacterium]|nr:O-antigen ligase family protein [Solirubrobacteraceae bacterium]
MEVVDVLQAAALVAAALCAAAVLLVTDARRCSLAMLASLVLGALALAPQVAEAVGGQLTRQPQLTLAAAAGGLVLLAALTALLRRQPAALAPLAVGTLAFRLPVPVADGTADLLVPLYCVIGAAALAFALRAARSGPGARVRADWTTQHDPARRRLQIVLAGVLVLYAAQALYSTDVERAIRNVAFFYVPFAVLFRLLLDLRWTWRLLLGTFGVAVGLALAFAAVGFVEYATGRLLIYNEKVLAANELKSYFRVNSLFFDPNIYGRFLALVMTALAGVLLWSRRRWHAPLIAVTLAVLWAGLVLSLSQSSFAALLAGLALLAALRWSVLRVLAAAAVAAAAGAAVLLLAPGLLGLERPSSASLDRATSGRVELVRGATAMFADRPVAGFGSGAFSERYRARENVRSPRAAAASHTIPLTIAAEQGVIGLAAYLALLAVAFAALLGRLREALRRPRPDGRAVARVVIAAAFAALVTHTLVYAAFLEDPVAWALLGIAAALRAAPGAGGADPEPAAGAATADGQGREVPNRNERNAFLAKAIASRSPASIGAPVFCWSMLMTTPLRAPGRSGTTNRSWP